MENKVTINPIMGESKVILHLLEGTAPEPINPTAAKFTGNIHAVKDYLAAKEKHGSVLETAVILFNTTGLVIALEDNPQSPLNNVITGKLEVHPKITEFGINSDKRFDSEQLKKIIKLHPHLFVSKESHAAFLRQLGNFKAKIERDLENSKDTRGGSKNQNNTQVLNLEIEEVFKMKCPLFKGGESVEFEVSVCYEVSGSGISFYFESPDVIIKSQDMANKEFEEQRKEFVERGYVTIMQ